MYNLAITSFTSGKRKGRVFDQKRWYGLYNVFGGIITNTVI